MEKGELFVNTSVFWMAAKNLPESQNSYSQPTYIDY